MDDSSLTGLKDVFCAGMAEFQNRISALESTNNPTVKKLSADFASFQKHILGLFGSIHKSIQQLEMRSDEFDSYTRRNNLLIHGLPEERDENLLSKTVNFIKDKLKINTFNSTAIESAFRLGKRSESNKARAVLIRFFSRHDRLSVWKNKKQLKGTTYLLTESLTKLRQTLYAEARNIFQPSSCWTRDGKIVVSLPNGTTNTITTKSQLDSVILQAKNLQKFETARPRSPPAGGKEAVIKP